MEANALQRPGAELRTIGDTVYQQGADGLLYPVGKVRAQPQQQPAPRNALNPVDGALNYYLGPTGIPERLNALSEMFNPVVTLGQSMSASQRMLAPDTPAMGRVEALGDMLSGVAGVAAPLVAAAKVGAPAASAVVDALTGINPGFVADESGALKLPRDPRLYHDASNIKLQMPVDEMQFGVQDTGLLRDAKVLDIADRQGDVLVPAFGDRTRAGGMLTSINGRNFLDPVPLQGGADFMRSDGGIWASEPGAMNTKARAMARIADETGQAPVMAYSAMGAQGGDFSRMMSDAVMDQVRSTAANIQPDMAARYDDIIRKKFDPQWPGIASPNAAEYVAKMPGTSRRELWQEMDRAAYRDAGFPDVGATRLAITDPRLLDAKPFDTGLTFGRLDLGAGTTDTPPNIHATYGKQVHGDYLGGLPEQVPGEMIWRDFFGDRRAKGAATASDQRSFMMKPDIRQRVDQQMVDEVSRYLEGRSR